MAGPADFARIAISAFDEEIGRAAMTDMLGPNWEEQRGPAAWAGFAAEQAIIGASAIEVVKATRNAYDLELPGGHSVEVKTRAATTGWTDPTRFDYVVIPTHDGREPIKDVDLVFFCWFSGDEPDRLWVLGYVRGREEFKRRASFYEEDQPLPRGGWAPKGGAYCIEIHQLRPLPYGLFRETE